MGNIAKAVVERISEEDLLEYEKERELDRLEMHYAIIVHEAEEADEEECCNEFEEFMKWLKELKDGDY